jgi:hypothetical protein
MKIRNNIFETNSSSTHSFVISGDKPDFIIPNIKQKAIIVQCDDYGWGPRKLTTWMQRAEYMATYAALYGGDEAVNKFETEMSDYLKVPVHIAMPRKNEYGDYDYYIDHQSIDYAKRMFENLKQTVFAKNAYISIDNDNH